MENYDKSVFLLCIFSIVFSLFFINIYDYPIAGDGITYYAYGLNLFKGNGYSYQESHPFLQSNFREPAYPVFISLLFKIFGVSKNAIQIAQAFLNGLIILITYRIAFLVLNNKKTAFIAAFLTALSPTIAGYASLLFSEILACVFLLLLTLFFLMLLKERENKKVIAFSMLTGFFSGCLILTKMTYLLFPFVILSVLFVMPADRLFKGKAILCVSVILISTLLPWLSFNNKIYGNPFFLTNRGGMSLAIGAERLNWKPKEISASFIYAFSETLLKEYFPEENKKVALINVQKIIFDKYAALIKNGYGEMAADRELRIDAFKRITSDMPKYIILCLSDFHYLLYFEGLPLSQFTFFFNKLTRGAINLFFKIYSLIIVFFSVKGAFIMFKSKENYFFKIVFLLPVFYTIFMYSMIATVPRFTFTVIPFIYIFLSNYVYKINRVKAVL